MAQVHTKSLRKRSTGLRRRARGKRKRDLGGAWSRTTIGDVRRTTQRTRGDNKKTALLATDEMVVSDGKKSEKVKVETVMENPANPHFVRRNIITKGAIVKTEKGFAKVTSSPGQSGTLSGVLLPDYTPKAKKSKKKLKKEQSKKEESKKAASKKEESKKEKAPKKAEKPSK